MAASNPRLLMTGIAGFTGRFIKDALVADGYEVFGVDEFGTGDNLFKVNLLDKPGLRAVMDEVKPTAVVHLAAIANVAHADSMEFYRVNLFGSMNLLEAIHESGCPVKKVLLASSANIYGNPPVSPVGEDTPPAPVNHYAMSKLAMEHLARTWLDRLPIVFTRPFNYTGIGQNENFLIPKIVGHFKRKEAVIRLGNLEVEREFNDVRMVAAAYAGILRSAEPGEAVNICTGRGYTMNAVLDMVRTLTGQAIEVQVDPRFVRPNELKRLVGSPTKLRAIVPGLPEYRLEETLQWMLDA